MNIIDNLFKKRDITPEEKERIKQEKEQRRQEKLQKLDEKIKESEEKLKYLQTVTLEHLGGYPKIKSGKSVKIVKAPGENAIKLNNYIMTIKAIEWSEKGKRSVGKAAAGAIIGGAMTGGLGLIAGAAIGGRKKDDSIIAILINENGIDYTVYFRANQKEYQKLASML